MIHKLKLVPVKLDENFGMSVREFEGITLSTDSRFSEEQDIRFFLCNVLHMPALTGLKSGVCFFALLTFTVCVNSLTDFDRF